MRIGNIQPFGSDFASIGVKLPLEGDHELSSKGSIAFII